jgi:hypothetical protein
MSRLRDRFFWSKSLWQMRGWSVVTALREGIPSLPLFAQNLQPIGLRGGPKLQSLENIGHDAQNLQNK